MNLSRKCCRCVGVVLIMLIGITSGTSAAQAGSEQISTSKRPSGDVGANKWASPSKATLVKLTSAEQIVVSPADAAKLRNVIKEVEAGLAKSEASQSQQEALIDLIGVIEKVISDKDNKSASTKSVSFNSISDKPIEVSPADAAMLRDKIKEVESKSGAGEVSSQKSLIGLIDLILKPLAPSK